MYVFIYVFNLLIYLFIYLFIYCTHVSVSSFVLCTFRLPSGLKSKYYNQEPSPKMKP